MIAGETTVVDTLRAADADNRIHLNARIVNGTPISAEIVVYGQQGPGLALNRCNGEITHQLRLLIEVLGELVKELEQREALNHRNQE